MVHEWKHAFDDDRSLRLVDHWTLSTTPMSKDEAEAAAALICKAFPHVHADPVDPQAFLTLSMDRATVETLQQSLNLLAAEGGDPGELLDLITEWLQSAPADAT